MTALLRARLARREWTITVEAVTPTPGAHEARVRIEVLADAMRSEDRVAALTLTDRTTAPDADPLTLAPEVTARSGKQTLAHIAGKGRTLDDLERTLRRTVDAGITSVLLTGGDPSPGDRRIDAVEMLTAARRTTPALLRAAVLTPAPGPRLDEAWRRTLAKRDAGAEALIAQVTWDLAQRETAAAWQTRLGVPVLGAVVMLTRHTLDFLERHAFTGLAVPRALRERVRRGEAGGGTRGLALDIAMLRRLGYAGAHISGVVTPRLVRGLLDESDRLQGALGDDWRDAWRAAVGIA